uniref:Uncharacterized protein n=1 Tax=Rhizophora mucronata TaxID=61149 RepID=A0A2P2QQT1_RHIMU
MENLGIVARIVLAGVSLLLSSSGKPYKPPTPPGYA